MINWKYFTVGHANHLLYNPLNPAKLDEVIDLAALPMGARVLDIACGNGEFLCRVAERYGASGVGIDLSPDFVPLARQRLIDRGLTERLEIIEGDGADYQAAAESSDMVSCLGASWIWNGYAGTLQALSRWTKPGGIILSGEPFLIGAPPAEYFETEDFEPDTFGSHVGNVHTGEQLGLRFLSAVVSSHDDWDRYEGYQSAAIERYAEANPEDPDAPEILRMSRRNRDIYLKWGRDHMGWAVYVFMKPGN